jgi:hypothetical protein
MRSSFLSMWDIEVLISVASAAVLREELGVDHWCVYELKPG